MYIGNMVQGKEKVSYKSKKIISTPEEEWIRIENTHEPVISKEVFYEAQNAWHLFKEVQVRDRHIFFNKG